MSRISFRGVRRNLGNRTVGGLGLGALLAAAVVASSTVAASAATTPVLKSANVPHYSGVLVNGASATLYLNTSEKGSRIHCTGHCLKIWRPLLVRSSTRHISLGSKVNGKIGFVARGKATKQVTFNSYPVYTFAGDTGRRQSTGEHVMGDGGTWLMLRAAAKVASATPVSPRKMW